MAYVVEHITRSQLARCPKKDLVDCLERIVEIVEKPPKYLRDACVITPDEILLEIDDLVNP